VDVTELASILLDTLTPVFLLVGVGWVVGSRLGLDAQTAARLAYYVLGPAFVFDLLATADLEAGVVVRLVVIVTVSTLVVGAVGWGVASLLGGGPAVVGAFALVAVYANVGNFGLPIVLFQLGEDALPLAGVVLVVVNLIGFLVGVTVAHLEDVHPVRAFGRAVRSPLVLASLPALAVNLLGTELPLPLARPIALLAQGMIPVLLLTLGLQLAKMGRPRVDRQVLAATGVRLLAGPAVTAGVAAALVLPEPAADVAVVQSAMPAAVFTALIAIEHDLEPDLVTTVVLLSTLVSAVTLTVVLALV
jgi:predicted permease